MPNFTGVTFEEMKWALRVFLGSDKVGRLTFAEVNPDHDPELEMVERLMNQLVGMLVARGGREGREVESGMACKTKHSRDKPYGNLQSPAISREAKLSIELNFIVKLLKSKESFTSISPTSVMDAKAAEPSRRFENQNAGVA